MLSVGDCCLPFVFSGWLFVFCLQRVDRCVSLFGVCCMVFVLQIVVPCASAVCCLTFDTSVLAVC